MALSPNEVKKRRQLLDAEGVAKIEKDIDEMLVNGGRAYACRSMTPEIRGEIIKRFAYVGWKVEYIHDQRDGDFLKFSIGRSSVDPY